MINLKPILSVILFTIPILSHSSLVCYLDVDSYASTTSGRKIEYSFKGGDKKDYKGNHILYDNDGFITAHLVYQDTFRLNFPEGLDKFKKENSKYFKIRNEKSNVLISSLKKIYKYNLKDLIPAILEVRDKSEIKDLKFYKQQLNHLEKITRGLLKIIQKIDSSEKSKIDIKTFMTVGEVLEEHLVFRKKNKSILNRTYDVPSSVCFAVSAYVYGADSKRRKCKTPLNPIGFPFNSLNLLTGKVKEPINELGKNSSNGLICTEYKVRIKDSTQDSSIKNESNSSMSSFE